MKRKRKPAAKPQKKKLGSETSDWPSLVFPGLNSPEWKARFADQDQILAELPPLDFSDMPKFDLLGLSPLPSEPLSPASMQKTSPKKRRGTTISKKCAVQRVKTRIRRLTA